MPNAKLHRQTPDYEPRFSRELGVPNIHPESVFSEVIQRDRSVCENCWQTRWDIYAEEFYGKANGWQQYERWYPIPGRNHPDALPNQRHDGTPRCCDNCGFESGRDRPLTLARACEYADNLSTALNERDIPHDREALLKTVRRRKQRPEFQSHSEDDVFGHAVAEAIRAAR